LNVAIPKVFRSCIDCHKTNGTVYGFVQCVLRTRVSSSRQQCSQFIVAIVLTWCSVDYILDRKLKVALSFVFIILHRDFKTWKC